MHSGSHAVVIECVISPAGSEIALFKPHPVPKPHPELPKPHPAHTTPFQQTIPQIHYMQTDPEVIFTCITILLATQTSQ